MGRRSSHTPQQLRDLILDAAQAIIESHGLLGLSAREIARRIEYSPGTIYNMFQNLDDVVLHVESRVLEELEARLAAVARDGDAVDAALRMSRTYLTYAAERPQLWNLLFEHHLPKDAPLPPSYQQRFEALAARVEEALAPLYPQDAAEPRRDAARALWASVHGIASLATADKFAAVTPETAGPLVDNLVRSYLTGVKAGAVHSA
jgi:AcrR family transcriptional regulator